MALAAPFKQQYGTSFTSICTFSPGTISSGYRRAALEGRLRFFPSLIPYGWRHDTSHQSSVYSRVLLATQHTLHPSHSVDRRCFLPLVWQLPRPLCATEDDFEGGANAPVMIAMFHHIACSIVSRLIGSLHTSAQPCSYHVSVRTLLRLDVSGLLVLIFS